MTKSYVDATGMTVANLIDNKLYKPNGFLIGTFNADGDIIDETSGECLISKFHEGLFVGPNSPAIAWQHPSEFDA